MNYDKPIIGTLTTIIIFLLLKDNFKFSQDVGFQIKPELLEAVIPTQITNLLPNNLTPCQSNGGKSVTLYLTGHGKMTHYPEAEVKSSVAMVQDMGVTNLSISYLFRGKYLGQKPNAIFQQYKPIKNRNIFKEIKKASKNKMCTTAFLEWGTQIPTKQNIKSEYLLRDKQGNTAFNANGVTTSYLNILNPIVRKSILDVVETASKTEGVDAIELDDHFAIENSFGYNPEFLELYKLAGGNGMPDETDPKFKEVRMKILNDLMRDIIVVAKTANPRIRINMMSLSLGYMKSKYNQDYGSMVKLGLSDVGVQVYGRTVPAITSQVQKLDKKTSVSLLLGLGNEFVPATTTVESIQFLKTNGFSDLALWGANSILYGKDAALRRKIIGAELKKW